MTIRTLALLIPWAAFGTTYPAATCSYADVSTAVSTAAYQDTVTVPTGNCTWSSTLTLTKGITLSGNGSANTVITRSGVAVDIDPDATSLSNEYEFRITGFTFDGNASALNLITVTGAGPTASKPFKKLIIGNNTFRNGSTTTSGGGAISTTGQVRGVIFSNTFDRINVILKILGNDDTTEWSNGNFPFSFGDADNLFFEDNTILYSSSYGGQDPGWTETGHGARLAVRYNTWNFTNATTSELWDIHGFQYFPGGQTGTMISEYYGNSVSGFVSGYRWINHRGSWGLFFNNIMTGGGGAIEANVYSCTADVPGASGVYKVEVNNTYVWNNSADGTPHDMAIGATGGGCGVNEDDEFYNYKSSCTSSSCSSGIGRGTTAPTGTCTVGVGYWVASTATPTTNSAVNQGGTLYKCTSTNTWTAYYTPYTYPHPLAAAAGSGSPAKSGGGAKHGGGAKIGDE